MYKIEATGIPGCTVQPHAYHGGMLSPGPGKGPPLPKPQARRVVQISPETPETSAPGTLHGTGGSRSTFCRNG